MTLILASTVVYFAQPWWLLAGVLALPVAWLGLRGLKSLRAPRRITATVIRMLVVMLLAVLLARPMVGEKSQHVTLLTVMDRSQSVPDDVRKRAVHELLQAAGNKPGEDRFGVVDAGEVAAIAKLPGNDVALDEYTKLMQGDQSYLSGGVQMAMAIAPPDTATRVLLVSDGNETRGDLREVARIAAANNIPIDVLPLQYRHEQEVMFSRIVAPPRARPGQTVPLRLVLNSTHTARGQLMLSVNGQPIILGEGGKPTAPVELKPGVNVKVLEIPLATQGMHEFKAQFLPDGPSDDQMPQNNVASAMTYVAGSGSILLVDSDHKAADALEHMLTGSKIAVKRITADSFPQRLSELVDADCVVLVNVANSWFSQQQQEMLCRYVTDLGGGLVMTGGPDAFGAGGWIGSPVASILPVEMDPPQKEEMPLGALVLIMHSCEMPNGNMWGKKTAKAAVNALSRLDLVGVISYQMNSPSDKWEFPLQPAGDKTAVTASIDKMQMGDMGDFSPHIQSAYDALSKSKAGQRHIIIITDGDPQPPSASLLAQCKKARITITGVAVNPHNASAGLEGLKEMTQATKGRFYLVQNFDELPQIFVKEAQTVRRALIVEDSFVPKLVAPDHELGHLDALPKLDGYILTDTKKGGLSRVILRSKENDPILAAVQSGLGKTVVFTSTADDRWAKQWLAWGGFDPFWERIIRYASRSASSGECEIYADVQDRRVDIAVESTDKEGNFLHLEGVTGQVIAPDMQAKDLMLRQVGPGRYHAQFDADASGSYLVNLQYGPTGARKIVQSVVTVPYAPEFQDLEDNTALLAEIAQTTGGRVLTDVTDKTDLFTRQGLKFPQTAEPLTRLLGLTFLGLFLLDVAVRRIAVDWAGIGRHVASLVRRQKAVVVDESLQRLQARRDALKKSMAGKAKQPSAHYEAKAGTADETALPSADLSAPASQRKHAKPEEKPQPQQDDTPMGRLLAAKKKAGERYKK